LLPALAAGRGGETGYGAGDWVESATGGSGFVVSAWAWAAAGSSAGGWQRLGETDYGSAGSGAWPRRVAGGGERGPFDFHW
jgi:hypothetical protein